jgi:hypothetical protein
MEARDVIRSNVAIVRVFYAFDPYNYRNVDPVPVDSLLYFIPVSKDILKSKISIDDRDLSNFEDIHWLL